MSIERLVRDAVKGIVPYRAPEQKGLRLDLNTNLFGPNPRIIKILKQERFDLNSYPAQNSSALRNALSKEFNFSPDCVVVGNGSDEIFDLVCKAFVNPKDLVAIPTPSFVMHKIYTKIHFGRVIEIPLIKNWQLDVSKFLARKPKLTIIASPNNPTANCFQVKDILKIVRESTGLVVLDEAYAEYAGKTLLPYLASYENLIITRTFSKAYALAGLRIGYALAAKAIINELNKVKPPYNLNLVSERLAIEALKDHKFLAKVVELTRQERAKLSAKLTRLGFVVYNSVANFVLAKSPINSKILCEKLKKRGIIIKDFGTYPQLKNCVRITVGKEEHNAKLIKNLRELLK